MSFSTSIRIRVTPELKALAHKRALAARSTVSDMVRCMIETGVPSAPEHMEKKTTAGRKAYPATRELRDGVRAELRRLGGLLKHLAPAGKSWASEEDKRRWWQVTENIEALGRGRQPPHVIDSLPPARAPRGGR